MRAVGLEPTRRKSATDLKGRRVYQFRHARTSSTCARLDSNQRPWDYGTPALSTELRAQEQLQAGDFLTEVPGLAL